MEVTKLSGRLVKDVLEYAPEDLSRTQLLVLIALAEDARDTDRIARFITLEQLANRARVTPATAKKILHELRGRLLITGVVHRPGNGRRQLYQVAFLTQDHRRATITPAPKPATNGHEVELPQSVTQLGGQTWKVG